MKFGALLASMAAAVTALFALSLLVGPAGVALGESLSALFGDHGALSMVMREIRLPRAILAVMVGASLGLAGAAMQGYLRNPLAEPGLIGVSGAAALGAVIALQTGLATAFVLALPVSGLGVWVFGETLRPNVVVGAAVVMAAALFTLWRARVTARQRAA